MSTIVPVPQGSTITLYRGVAWDNSLGDIRLFNSESERANYLAPLALQTWTQCTVADPGKSFKVSSQNFNLMVTADYMSFTNNIGEPYKTFYAFVTNVSFINTATIEVEYEIDWIQSYLFDLQVGQCFVEQEHVNDDTIGLHTIEEKYDYGEYTIRQQLRWVHSPAVLISYLTDSPSSKVVNNVITAIMTSGADLSYAADFVNNIITLYNDAPERVVSVQMGVTNMVGTDGIPQNFGSTRQIHMINQFAFNGRTYTPQNNKMLCYPYRLLTVDNFMGDVEQYRWENFKTDTATFAIEGAAIPKPTMECFPIDYMGATATDVSTNRVQQMSVVYDNFPVCPYANDTFRAWVSQYGASTAVKAGASVVSSVAALAGAAATGGSTIPAAAGLANTAANTYQEYKSHKIHSLQMHGGVGEAGLNYAREEVGFRCTDYAIRPEHAERIDRIMTRYGYTVDTAKVPNIKGRQYVNYVKCSTARVEGLAPIQARNALEQALLQGVSFWHTNNIGMTVNSNPIVTTSS